MAKMLYLIKFLHQCVCLAVFVTDATAKLPSVTLVKIWAGRVCKFMTSSLVIFAYCEWLAEFKSAVQLVIAQAKIQYELYSNKHLNDMKHNATVKTEH